MLMPASHEPDDPEIVPWYTLRGPRTYPSSEYGRACEKLFFNLLELVSLGLGLPPKRLHGYFENQASFARLNYYARNRTLFLAPVDIRTPALLPSLLKKMSKASMCCENQMEHGFASSLSRIPLSSTLVMFFRYGAMIFTKALSIKPW